MTLLDPSDFDTHSFLFVESIDFPQVLALPQREPLPEGDHLTFHFGNGYGAAVIRRSGRPMHSAFEFCVLDCAGSGIGPGSAAQPRPTFLTHIARGLLADLSYEQVAQLLPQVERLPLHPDLNAANVRLEREEF